MNAEDTIPNEARCLEIMAGESMLPNIVEHSRQVMRVSLAIADNAIDPGTLNRPLLIAASLLHDITKTRSLTTHERHDVTGAELLREMGMRSVAYVVGQHIFLTDFDEEGPLEEREIVYYADKCVMHETVVSVNRRVEDLLDRYGSTEKRREMILANKALILCVERKINRFLRDHINDVVGNRDL